MTKSEQEAVRQVADELNRFFLRTGYTILKSQEQVLRGLLGETEEKETR